LTCTLLHPKDPKASQTCPDLPLALAVLLWISPDFPQIFAAFFSAPSHMGKEKVATQHRHIRTEDPVHGLLLASLIRIIQNVILGEVPIFLACTRPGYDIHSSPWVFRWPIEIDGLPNFIAW